MTDMLTVLPDKTLTKQELQAQLKIAIKKIDTKLKVLMRGGSAQAKSGGNFIKVNENDQDNVNILTSVDVCYLIKALATANRIKKEYEQTAKEEKLETYPVCFWCSYPIDAWIHDLRMRIGVVTNAKLITDLTESRKKLETFLTEEQRLHVTLNEIAALIKGK